MNTNCLDTGAIQAFLDGELSPAAASTVSAHIGECDACAVQLSKAEEESSFVFSVLEREMNSLVPTQRLWTRINDTIVTEKDNAPLWKKGWAILRLQLGNPSLAVVAGLLMVFGLFVIVLVERNTSNQQPDVVTGGQPPRVIDDAIVQSSIQKVDTGSQTVAGNSTSSVAVRGPERTENAIYRPDARSASVRPKGPMVVQAAYIPGEESYVKTIANLSQTVSGQKDNVMRPSERISYERDMAVVDDAIAKMRKEVRRNPKNESAKQVLYTSYQSKIDLLNSVSQKEELMASLR